MTCPDASSRHIDPTKAQDSLHARVPRLAWERALSAKSAGLVYQRLVCFGEIYVVLTLVFPASRTVLSPATLALDDPDTF